MSSLPLRTLDKALPKPTATEFSETLPTDSPRAWLWAFLLTPLVSLLTVCLFLNVFNRDLNIPFEYGHDAFLVTVPIKTMVEEGWWYESAHLGAPMKMEFYDYPSSPNLHIAILKVMALFESNAFRLVNYYFLLSFPLIAICTLAAFKAWRLGVWPSVVLTLLFTLSPYHFWRGIAHLWLGVYFTVPLAMILIAWLVQDRAGFLIDGDRGTWRSRFFSRPSLIAIAICASLGFDFPYYPIFAAFILLVMGPFVAYRLSSWRPLVRSVGLIGLIACFFVANLLPNLVYRVQHGKNYSETLATIRHWSHAEMFGLKIAPMLLAAENHPLKSWDRKRQKYLEGTVAYSSGSSQALGSTAALGFLALVGWLLVRQNRGRKESDQVMDSMSIMNVACLLLATVGGFSAVANLLSIGVLRGYDRISIFIMFFALVPIGLGMMRWQSWASLRKSRQVAYACSLVLIAGVGMFEQSRYCRMPGPTQIAEYNSDKNFVDMIARDTGDAGRIFQYPVQNFLSQAGPAIRWDPYTHFRGYAHSSTLTWSFGAVVGRAPAQVQNWIDALPPAQAVETLALMDFGGIYVDRKLYDDNGDKFEAALKETLKREPVMSEDNRFCYFSLKEYTAGLASKYSAEELAARRDAAQHPLIAEWDSIDAEEVYPTERFRWCQGKSARLCLINLGKSPKSLQVKFSVATSQDPDAQLTIKGLGQNEKLPIGTTPKLVERNFVVPPGTHIIKFLSDAEPLITPARNVTFRVCDFNYAVSDAARTASHTQTIAR